jgi:hypothetical protein
MVDERGRVRQTTRRAPTIISLTRLHLPLPLFADNLLTYFLDRTCAKPFSFTLFESRLYFGQQDYHARSIVQVLLEHSGQWDQATIQFKWPEMRLLRAAKGHLPLLKKLHLIVPDHQDDDLTGFLVGRAPVDLTLFYDAPLLTRVILRKIIDWQFNWSTLTILDLYDIPEKDHIKIFNILRETVTLVELSIWDAFCLNAVDHDSRGVYQWVDSSSTFETLGPLWGGTPDSVGSLCF